mgnify:CR=1 FL=1
MSEAFTLYYWPLPFRGQFVRAVLAHVGASWDEPGSGAVAEIKNRAVTDQPVPLMAPPVLVDHEAGVTLAQFPAILMYLGGKFGLIPEDPALAALAHKIVADTNDVLDEITLFGGRTMWARSDWESFAEDRLPRWMQIFEETGTRHGLTHDGGTMLGTAVPGLADLVTAVLWFTITDKLPQLRGMLDTNAPSVAALAMRIMDTPALEAMRADTGARFGGVYCGGMIEASIREMLESGG